MSTVSKEDNLVVMASEVSSYPDETELELGLGLTLGCGGNKKSTPSVLYTRILTAKDLPSHKSALSSSSSSLSSSSSSSSSPSSLSKANVSVGTKRNADSLAATVNQAVGWPPVGAYRMNSLVNQAKSPATGELNSISEKTKSKNTVVEKTNNGIEKNIGNAKENGHLRTSLFVKVNMDGNSIGRKVDLSVHSCYETLAQMLEEMFCKPPAVKAIRLSGEERNTMVEARRPSKLLDGSSEFVLTYQDKDGDLMLVGDVPWEMFLCSVKRLRIMRASDANGLAPRFQEMTGIQRSKAHLG